MPSFQDSAFIILLGLLLFGPKGLAKIARQAGKLVGEFRRASADFRLQMEDELRISEQEDKQKKIAAMEDAAPVSPLAATPLLHADMPDPEHPHTPPVLYEETLAENQIHSRVETPMPVPLNLNAPAAEAEPASQSEPERPAPLPIASEGNLHLMPPATGLPIARTNSVASVFDSIPHTADPDLTSSNHEQAQEQEATRHG